ncbi:MAG TPA: hypothetical protein VK892_05415 [Pyrinomonadaceae bacterium]|nr:hypothetical protein [Pyrinomonadaceae bacterium]
MPDPVSLAAGYFLFKTAVSMGLSLSAEATPNSIGDELSKAAGGNFYYDILKFGSRTAWREITSRLSSEYNSNKLLNHDLQKAVRKGQIEATLSACESCFDDLKIQDTTLLEKLRNKLSLREDERWLKNVIQTLTKNLAEIRDENYIPPTITDNVDVLKIADVRNYPLTNESVQNLINSIKEQTILEIRVANSPNELQKPIALSLEQKIYFGWTKNFQDEIISIDWYKLLCERFNEEYKTNQRVTNALQRAFFQDLKSDLAGKFTNFSENHFEELGGKILSKLETIESKQDRLYNFVEIFKDETDKKLTEALALLRNSVSEINTVTKESAKETQDVTIQVGDKIIEANKSESEKLFERIDKRLVSQSEEIQIKIEETLQKTTNFRRNILAKRNLTVIERLLGNRRFPLFDKLFGKLTPQEEFFVSLKERYANRYLNKLDGRFEITLMVSDDLESEVKKEYTGIYEGRGQLNEAFEYMRNAFQYANRLLIVGEPGVGKTVLLLKFANDLLDKTVEKLKNQPELRLDDIKDPIP